jgi:hypothetical protein
MKVILNVPDEGYSRNASFTLHLISTFLFSLLKKEKFKNTKGARNVFFFIYIALQDNLNSPPVFNGVRVAKFFLLCVLFCRSLFVLFSFDHCVCLVFFDLRIMIIPVVSSA